MPVRLLVLDDGAKRVIRDQEAGKDDQLWLGDARDPLTDESFPVYLRISAPTPLVAELLCAVIARMLGLPAPEAFVVAIPPGALAGSSAAANTLYVGTLDVGGSTFSQLLRADSVSAANILRKWEHLVPVAALDEWLANPDRNWGNILYVANTLHIIDHAEAFGGRSRNLFGLTALAEDQLTNKLAIFLTDSNAGQRQTYLAKAKEWLTSKAGALDINIAVAIAQVTRWQTPAEEAELVQFITNRIKITHRLLCQRLGHPQLALTH
jgi:hypothetical protein